MRMLPFLTALDLTLNNRWMTSYRTLSRMRLSGVQNSGKKDPSVNFQPQVCCVELMPAMRTTPTPV